MIAQKRPAVFLDRDGVLNRNSVVEGLPVGPTNVEEFALLPGVAHAVAKLKSAGYVVVVVTNQPDVARHRISRADLDAMHARLREDVPVDAIYVCLHDDKDGCSCRKPKAGMLFSAAGDLGIDLPASFMVGDRWRDIDAGKAAGCFTILVDHGYREPLRNAPDARVRDLTEAAALILETSR